ncbi:MAG: Rv3654c family TadE-like protein [Candidatus Nanopelagicales bacterium]
MSEQGSGTVLGLAAMAVVAMFGMVALAQLQAVSVTHALQGAADLTAVGAAQAVDDQCAVAAQIAEANGARLTACSPVGLDVVVQVETDAPSLVANLLKRFGFEASPLRARARAGLPESSTSG